MDILVKTYTRELIPRARSMRTNMPEPERIMWYQCLSQLPYRFRRQRPFGSYIVDFYCAKLKLVIELDGESHTSPEAIIYDKQRTEFLTSLGLKVLRFHNHEIMQNIEGVFERLQAEIKIPLMK